jgi:hypothetical protein
MAHVNSSVSTQSMIINKKKSTMIEGTEQLTPVWLENWHHCHMPISLRLFQRKPQVFLEIEDQTR